MMNRIWRHTTKVAMIRITEVVNWKTGGVVKHVASVGVVKGDVNGHLNGAHSRNSASSPVEVVIYTQEGVAMLSSVLSSPSAVQVNIAIMRAFIRLRQMVLSVDELSRKVADLERGYKQHGQQFDVVFKAIRQLMAPPPEPPRKKIGF